MHVIGLLFEAGEWFKHLHHPAPPSKSLKRLEVYLASVSHPFINQVWLVWLIYILTQLFSQAEEKHDCCRQRIHFSVIFKWFGIMPTVCSLKTNYKCTLLVKGKIPTRIRARQAIWTLQEKPGEFFNNKYFCISVEITLPRDKLVTPRTLC